MAKAVELLVEVRRRTENPVRRRTPKGALSNGKQTRKSWLQPGQGTTRPGQDGGWQKYVVGMPGRCVSLRRSHGRAIAACRRLCVGFATIGRMVSLPPPSGESSPCDQIHLVGAIHVRSAHLPSGTGSRFGTDIGAGWRAGQSGGTHPVNRSQLERRLEIVARSRPIARWTGARFGHDPERVIDRRARRGRERRTRGRQKQRHSTW